MAALNFAYEASRSYSWGFLTFPKILHLCTDSFTSLPKEAVLRICIALESPLSSTGFEPANLGSSG
jgi:hypothetical protein